MIRHRLRRDDGRHRRRGHHRQGRRHPQGQVGPRAGDVPRADDRRLPEPVHDHRPGQPVGAVEHVGVDRAARRLDRRPGRRLRDAGFDRIEPTRDGPGRLGPRTSTTAATSRCSRRPTRGTWAPTCPASRACSCRTSAASTSTARRATPSSSRSSSASSSPVPPGRSATTAWSTGCSPTSPLVLDMMAGLDLPPLESMTAEEARDFMTEANAARPPGPEVGEIVDGTLPGRRRRPRLPPVPAGVTGAAPARRLLPRRWLGARQPRDRRPVLPRPVRALGHGHRVGRLPPRPGGPLPGGRRRRVRRPAVDRRPHRRARWHPRPADRRRVERRGQPRRRRQPEGA